MAGARVAFSAEARADVTRLTLRIGRDAGFSRAQMIVDRLNATIARLSRRPRIGRVQKNWEGEPHVFGVRPWIVVYEPFREGDGIHILRILDSRQDLLAMLGKKT